MKCGIIGLSGSGKTTLFNCISNNRAETHKAAFSATKSNLGVMNVPDPRLKVIDDLIHSARILQTTIEMVDIPGLSKGGSHTEGNKFLTDIRNVDALIHVIRCFDDPMMPHIEGSVDPVRDKEIVDLELQIKDLESVEKKIGRKLSQGAFDGIGSFTLNVGCGRMMKNPKTGKHTDIYSYMLSGDEYHACMELQKYVYAAGVRLPGLDTRRGKEAALCQN